MGHRSRIGGKQNEKEQSISGFIDLCYGVLLYSVRVRRQPKG